MEAKQKVLIAEDDSNLRDLLQLIFDNDFELSFANAGDQAAEMLAAQTFDFVIFDIQLPVITGLELCRSLQQMPSEQKPGVIILSADTSENTVKQAYELGVDDYISKPFDITIFHERVNHFANQLKHSQKHQSQGDSIQSLAETAMTQAASYGAAMQLMAALNQCHFEQSMANEVLKYFQKDDIHAAIQFRKGNEIFTFDIDRPVCSQIELQVFELLKDHGRIYHFGKRCIFNDRHVSILIKNMPQKGTMLYDSVLDVVAKLVPAIDARFLAICDHKALIEAKDTLGTVMQELATGLSAMEADKKKLIESLELQIGLSFHELSMDEAQEQYFVNLIEKELVQRNNSEHFDKLQSMIAECIQGIDQEIDESGTPQEAAPQISTEDDDIELF